MQIAHATRYPLKLGPFCSCQSSQLCLGTGHLWPLGQGLGPGVMLGYVLRCQVPKARVYALKQQSLVQSEFSVQFTAKHALKMICEFGSAAPA
jgi:hypothetical protein